MHEVAKIHFKCNIPVPSNNLIPAVLDITTFTLSLLAAYCWIPSASVCPLTSQTHVKQQATSQFSTF